MSDLLSQSYYWVKDNGRTYQCYVVRNLFGGYVVVRQWGSIHSNSGQAKEYWMDCEEAAQQMIADVMKQRSKRGYSLCKSI